MAGHLDDTDRALIPAQARLDRHRARRRLDDGLGDRPHLGQIAQDARPPIFADHLLHRAAEVDVDEIWAYPVDDLGGLAHLLDVPSEDLDADGPLLLVDVELHDRVFGVVDEAPRGDELGVDHVCPVALAKQPERGIAHVLHGREEERSVAKI